LADPGLVPGPREAIGSSKKLLIRLRESVALNGPPPDDYVEATIAERFGWPLSVLEGEDEGRVLRSVKLLNMATSYRRALEATRLHRPESVQPSDWEIFQMMDSLGETDD
jgi:hypothetical protein